MTELPVLIAAILPVIAVLLTTVINNRSNSRTRESQQRHEERLKNLELLNSQTLRLNEEKRSAYTDVLSEVGVTYAKQEQQIEAQRAAGKSSATANAIDLGVATARAKLLLDPSRWEAYDQILREFYMAHHRNVTDTQNNLTTMFAEDLAT
jgi:ABC-type thiamine transport system ATPase subunit